MDDDELDGDIADEDLMDVFEQAAPISQPAPVYNNSRSSTTQSSRPLGSTTATQQQRPTSGCFPARDLSTHDQPRASVAPRKPPELLQELEDIPSDAFDSSPAPNDPPPRRSQPAAPGRSGQRSSNSRQAYHQTTLFGDKVSAAQAPASQQSQRAPNRVYRADLPPEAPTQHALDYEALKTWVYPTNLGPIRDYQFSIVKSGLFSNTLVALPTGLGKTFIAATIMLNYYRWTKDAKIIFVAPTKPLASQQIEACLNIAGIPRSEATLLTGETAPALREEEWACRRLFFMTPQTLQNDLGKGYADPKSIVLLVIDEAHRATGDYAYVKVTEFIRRFSKSLRVLALTATPGSTVEGVQEVIDNLGISHVEIRTEDSLDIRQYVHERETEEVTLDPSDEIMHISELFGKALKPLVDKLSSQNIYWGRDPMKITTYGLMQKRNEWMQGPGRHVNQGAKFMVVAVFTVLQTLAHSIKLLNYHGIKPFYDNLAEIRNDTESRGEKGSKLKRQLMADENFIEMMSTTEKWLKLRDFVGHPKMTYLCDHLLNHFMDAGEGASTRAIVFSEYRDSAEEIVRTLNSHKPLISATIFVGQADSKRSEGMKQKQQIETIAKFRNGGFNVLVATSIGEEGLDIGQVDLIICYDASSSPIRMLQRMGRTARKRAGKIVLLMMKGAEEDKFSKAKDNYAQMQKFICEGSRFTFRHDLSSRIVPRDAQPEVDKRFVEIPIENTQDSSLPEPKKSRGRTAKKPSKKKFHMPDGVETGFLKASAFGRPAAKAPTQPKKRAPTEADFVAEVPDLGSILLNKRQEEELNRLYRDLPPTDSDHEEISGPCLTAYPILQRTLRPTVRLQHGAYTRRWVKLFEKLGNSQATVDRWAEPYGETDNSRYKEIPVLPFAGEPGDASGDEAVGSGGARYRKRPRARSWAEGEEDILAAPPEKPKRRRSAPKAKAAPTSRKQQRTSLLDSDLEVSEGEEEDEGAEDVEQDFEEPPTRRGRGRPKGGGKKQRGGHGNGGFEERGDDCMRSSFNYETDGSDSGGDLRDFIVDDDDNVYGLRDENEDEDEDEDGRGGTSTSPTTASHTPASSIPVGARGQGEERDTDTGKGGSKPFFVPLELPPTQNSVFDEDDDDEMPDISNLGKRSGGPTAAADSVEEEEEDDGDEGDEDVNVRSRPAARRDKRALIDDSESNE